MGNGEGAEFEFEQVLQLPEEERLGNRERFLMMAEARYNASDKYHPPPIEIDNNHAICVLDQGDKGGTVVPQARGPIWLTSKNSARARETAPDQEWLLEKLPLKKPDQRYILVEPVARVEITHRWLPEATVVTNKQFGEDGGFEVYAWAVEDRRLDKQYALSQPAGLAGTYSIRLGS